MAFLDHVRRSHQYSLDDFVPFEVDGKRVGHIRRRFLPKILQAGSPLQAQQDAVTLAPSLETFEQRSNAFDRLAQETFHRQLGLPLLGEMYPLTASFYEPPLLHFDRAIVTYFGARSYGVHVNGFVRRSDGLSMWVARRASDKRTYPGMLDNMVAGGQPVGISLRDNVIKEAEEEAGIPRALAEKAQPCGAIAYCREIDAGLKPDVQFVFDLELPQDFEPENRDGEVESFQLLPIQEVAEIVDTTQEFKLNCNLVIIDFLIRHGYLPPEHPDYLKICRGLVNDCPIHTDL